MENTIKTTDNPVDDLGLGIAPDGDILFQSGSRHLEDGTYDPILEEMAYNEVMRGIEGLFTPSVLVGSIGLWDGKRVGYCYCPDYKKLRSVIAEYDDVIIRHDGTRLYFTLIHHDGRHEMELRRLTEYGDAHVERGILLTHFRDCAVGYIKRHTEDYGTLNVFHE